jgi:hypothetical protein
MDPMGVDIAYSTSEYSEYLIVWSNIFLRIHGFFGDVASNIPWDRITLQKTNVCPVLRESPPRIWGPWTG